MQAAERAPDPRGQREGSQRGGQPGPRPLPGGPWAPPTAPPRKLPPGPDSHQLTGRGGAASGGPRGRPRRAVGRLRGAEPRSSRLPEGRRDRPHDLGWAGGGEELTGRRAPSACLRGLGPGPGHVRHPGPPPAAPAPARSALGAPRPESAGLRPGAGGRRAGPTPPSPPPPRQQPAPRWRGRAVPCAARAPRRSPAFPRRAPRRPSPRRRLGPAEGGFVPGGGLPSHHLPPAAL